MVSQVAAASTITHGGQALGLSLEKVRASQSEPCPEVMADNHCKLLSRKRTSSRGGGGVERKLSWAEPCMFWLEPASLLYFSWLGREGSERAGQKQLKEKAD